jgi:hypothetical protein
VTSAILVARVSEQKMMSPNHGNSGCSTELTTDTPRVMREGPREGGLASRGIASRILDLLLVPRDPRGIVLLCGFMAAVLFGLVAILTPPSDPIGWAYIALGVLGYFFIQTRMFTTFVWLLVAAGGAAVAWAGNPSGWVETGLGIVLTAVSLLPLPAEYRERPMNQITAARKVGLPQPQLEANGSLPTTAESDSSRKLEDASTQSSTDLEVSAVTPASSNGATVNHDVTGLVQITALGQLRIEVGGRDITRRLSEPRLVFLFSYLLARQVRGVDVAVDRGVLAEEVAPGISGGSQRDRLRKQLYDLQAADPAFEHLLRSNRAHVSLDIEHAEFDVGRLLTVSRGVRNRDLLIDTDLAEQLRIQLDGSKGDFLAGFSELEHQVTGGRGTAGQVVEEARSQVAAARADLAICLAKHDHAIGRPALAIPYLQDALSGSPQRQDLARVLVAAFLQTGQIAAATKARRDYEIEES